MLVTLTGPSCAGKSTLEGYLKKRGFASLVSTTTRAPRTGELNAEHYYFVGQHEFEWRVQAGRFVEHIEFNGSRYGVEAHEVNRKLAQGKPVVIVVEPVGLLQIEQYAKKANWPLLRVFVSNPQPVIWSRFLKRTILDYTSSLVGSRREDILLKASARVEDMRITEQRWIEEAFAPNQERYDIVLSRFDNTNENDVVELIMNLVHHQEPTQENLQVPQFLRRAA